MTLEELHEASPAGLNNAQIRSFARDLRSERLTMLVKIVVGLSKDGNRQPQYRDGEICFHGVRYFVSKTQSNESTCRDCSSANFSFIRAEFEVLPATVDKSLSPDTLRYSLWMQDQHAIVNIVAREISFNWSSLIN